VVSTPNGTTSDALVAADLAHVAWAVNMGCLGFHVWPTRADDPQHADELRIDLDPSPGVTFAMVREAAWLTRGLLEELGLAGWPKTTGNRGIHVWLRLEPRWTSTEVRSAAVALARELERRRPDLVTAAWWKEERGRRVFVDFNQNAPHKTVFGAWCVRARPGAQVSAPFHWDELDEQFHPDQLTMPVVAARVARDGDPWAGMYEHAQSIEPLLAMYDHDLAGGLMDAPWPPVYPKQPNEPPRVAPSRAKKDMRTN
jgi:DNA ligase D-like protein (predicted polymerase)